MRPGDMIVGNTLEYARRHPEYSASARQQDDVYSALVDENILDWTMRNCLGIIVGSLEPEHSGACWLLVLSRRGLGWFRSPVLIRVSP